MTWYDPNSIFGGLLQEQFDFIGFNTDNLPDENMKLFLKASRLALMTPLMGGTIQMAALEQAAYTLAEMFISDKGKKGEKLASRSPFEQALDMEALR